MPVSDGAQLVVVGVDGSAESPALLRWAARYAAATGARVRVVRAWRLPELAVDVPARAEFDLSRTVENGVARLVQQAFGDRPVETVVEEGGAVRLLLREAKDADLLVLGCQGGGQDPAKLLGSVTQSCLLQATCPVVVVPPTAAAGRHGSR